MGIGEGAAVAGLVVTLAGIVFQLGRAWGRLKANAVAIGNVKRQCAAFTETCTAKQEARYVELRARLDGVKEDTQAVREAVAIVRADVSWLRKNGGCSE